MRYKNYDEHLLLHHETLISQSTECAKITTLIYPEFLTSHLNLLLTHVPFFFLAIVMCIYRHYPTMKESSVLDWSMNALVPMIKGYAQRYQRYIAVL